MKQIVFINFFVILFFANSFAQNRDLQNLGLVSQLVEIKYCSEGYIFNMLNKDIAENDKIIALKKYNIVRVQVDRIIYQLSVDLKYKNSLKLYKKLDKYYKSNSFSESINVKDSYKHYSIALDNAYSSYKSMLKFEEEYKATIELATVLSIIDLGWTIIDNISETNGNKVEGVIEILDNLRLRAPSELKKKEEKKGEN